MWMCVCEELINALSLLAVVSLVMTGWVPSSCHLLFPTSHISSCCQRLITICSVLEITKRSSFLFSLSCVFYFFPTSLLRVLVSGVKLLFVLLPAWRHTIWLQRIENRNAENECFASLTSLAKSPFPHSACNTDTFQKWMFGLWGSQSKSTPVFNLISIRICFSQLLVLNNYK